MKKLLTFLVLTFTLPVIYTFGQNVGINDDASTPNASAMLDVKSTTRGLLPPRVSLTSTTSASPVTSPTAGLLVYNTATAGDVTPGYYYWDGTTAWIRFNSGTTQLHVVTKTANATLLKTDQFVLASNEITLTLPTVTTTDDGLAITIKNVGTYTDLIKVQGNGGATIDGRSAAARLTRWKSDTYIANGGNWLVKEEQIMQDNIYEVSDDGSFTTIAEAIAYLSVSGHMTAPSTIHLGGGNYTVSATQTINFSYPLTIEGTSYGESKITVTAGNPAFACSSECYFKMVDFDGNAVTSSDALLVNGTYNYYEVKDCNFTGFRKSIALTGIHSTIWIFETDFNDASTAGVEVSGGSVLKVSECDFINCSKGINLASGTGDTVSILNCTFYNLAGQTGIFYDPAAFVTFASIFITNNAWNNLGAFISGFDFTRSDGRDAKAFIENNAGMESKRPHCKVNVINSVNPTTVTTAGTYYKAAWTNSATNPPYTCKWTVATGAGTGNRITYQPVNSRDVIISITGNLSVNGAAKIVSFGFCKQGVNTTRYGEETMYISAANQMFQFSTVAYISDVTANDYFEFFVTSSANGDILTVSDVNLFANSQ